MKYTWLLYKLAIIAFLILRSTQTFAENSCMPNSTAVELQSNLNELVVNTLKKNPAIPGISLHVKSTKFCFEFDVAKGMSDKTTKVKLKTNHVFRIASNTKTYTAATVLRLIEEGKIDIDSSIANYLPENFSAVLSNGGYQLKNISIRNLLNHMGGLPEHTRDKRYFESIRKNPSYEWSALEQVNLIVKYQMPIEPPAKKFSYSDTGYILLGTAIEHVTNMSMIDAFKYYLKFSQLGINKTWHETKEPQPSTIAGRAHQYFGETDTYGWHASLDLYGGGGLVSTAKDMGTFLSALMMGQIFEQPATLKTMKTVLPAAKVMNYGMGLFSKEMGPHLAWGHTGFWNTFSFYIPELDLSISGSITQKEAIKGSVFTNKALNVFIETLDREASL